MDSILNLVQEYITKKDSEKKWVAGEDLVQYAGPYFDGQEAQAVVRTMLEGWLVLGKEGAMFERRFPKKLGQKTGVIVNSGSSANLLMMLALTSKRGMNLPKGTKVITPIAGFPATLSPTIQVGFTPIFVDIELESLNSRFRSSRASMY
jgi:CDP-4-dehydro-6-deoxyglucose reductase, E1